MPTIDAETIEQNPRKITTSLCAIYTRKSSDENLNSDFTSLDSQREYCQSFVKSREGEGWRVHPEEYNDPGFSGGNMDRPGLRKLLADVRARKFQVVVCYKYDRLSRHVKDFLQILEVFEQHGAAFVSVTQPIDTTSSVGRLMRSILMDFSQFEREMISERTRDKLFAMAKRGKRTGGHPILGYDIDKQKKTLLINPTEAKQALEMFKAYLATKSLSATAKALSTKGYKMKRWETRHGTSRGGSIFNKATVFNLLRNPIYIGKIVHRGKTYTGEHEAIIPEHLFNEVANLLVKNGNGKIFKDGFDLKHNYILRGLLKCAICGTTMTPHTSHNRVKQKYFYYRCISVNKLDKTACPVRDMPAKALEEHVLRRLGILGENIELIEKVVSEAREVSSTELPIKRDEKKRHAADLSRKESAVKNLLAHLAQENPGSKRRERILAEIDTYMAGEEELKARLAKLDEEIADLEKREIDAEVVRRNLSHFRKLYDRLSPADQRELMHLLLKGVILDAKACMITLELNPLPDLWAGWTNTEDVLVDRQISLPELYGKHSDWNDFLQSKALFAVKSFLDPVLILWDYSKFDTIRTAKGKIETVVPLVAAAIRSHQRRHKQTPAPQPPSIQILLKTAYRLKRRLEENPKLTRARLAREEGINASYLSRILNLLKLVPEIQSHILKMPPSVIQSPASERKLQHLARNLNRTRQLEEFNRIKSLIGRARIPSPTKTNHFFLRINPANFPVDLGYQLLPAVKDLN